MSVRILVGDAREQLRKLPDESVHCVVTSPPYWGLRAYQGDPGMIGLEPTFEAHLENLLAVFREVRRVLRGDGTVWLNYGDAYAATMKGSGGATEKQATNKGSFYKGGDRINLGRYKPKDLMMMPARVALALQADGWWLRSEIIWHKPNPMPESVTDRPTSAHERIFLMAKSSRYFYDSVAVRRPSSGWNGKAMPTHAPENAKSQSQRPRMQADVSYGGVVPGSHRRPPKGGQKEWEATGQAQANLRNVWTIPTAGYSQAHFATFPPALIEPCIKAGTSEAGCCSECGAPAVRVFVKSESPHDGKTESAYEKGSAAHRMSLARQAARERGEEYSQKIETIEWKPGCDCNGSITPCTVLDPFGGAGTTALVADRLGRDAILIEISDEYAEMARHRIEGDAPLFANVQSTEITNGGEA